MQSVRQLQGDSSSPRRNLNSSKLLSTVNSTFKPEDSILEPQSPVGQTSEERALKVREFVNRARYQDFKEIPVEEMGFEITKIDYTSFRRNFGSLMNQEQHLAVEKGCYI